MKQISLIFAILFFSILSIVNSIKMRHKTRHRSTYKAKHKSYNYAKTDGPIDFSHFDDSNLRQLLKNEKTIQPHNISSNNAIEKSKTFRSVSPLDDSTRDITGKKYSEIYSQDQTRISRPYGYYGASRLTR